MMGSRPNSGAADVAKGNIGTAQTPKGSKAANGIPRHAAARAAERSPASADRRSPKTASRLTTPLAEKQGSAAKQSHESHELQAQLAAIMDDLKMAKEQLAEKETEKRKALAELEDARRIADEAKEKHRDALAAQKRAEEASETEMFRAVELEQKSIDSMQRKQELQRKLETMRSQHAADAAALRSMGEQLEKARYELADAVDAKNLALSQTDDAIRASEVSAGEVERLNAEINQLKDLFDSELESRVKEHAEKTSKLEAEASVLRIKLNKAKVAEEKVAELEGVVEALRADVANAVKVRREADELVGEWKKKAEILEIKLEVANQSSILKAESLNSVMKELDDVNALLQEKESALAVLQDKVESLEHEVVRQNEDINLSGQRLDVTQREASELRTEIEELRSKLHAMEEEKMDAINNGSLACSQIETICEEKDRLAKELESSRDESEKVRKAMEDLASTLQEMSADARESRERYLNKQEEIERTRAQVDELNMNLMNTRENYEVMLDEANYERVCLKNKLEQMEAEARTTSEQWQSKELSFVSSIRKSEDEIMSMRIQLDKSALTAKDRENRNAELEEKLKELEAYAATANRGSKESKTYKENEQTAQQENGGLQALHAKESSGPEKIKELYSLIGNAKHIALNGTGPKGENDKGYTEKDGSVMVASKMRENSRIADYNLYKEKDDGELRVDLDTNRDTTADGSRVSIEKTNSNTKLVVKQHQQKKALMKKFGGLLKKKSQH
ncbi:hypothetical protein GUJ93_ZPchr0006g42212 [Zizania palustris]|uniref:Uncharacterized protein n=1 Tax=Zizania palustris TaxID=103762 RepID=A0A8J5SLR2_ZIZPA|nr:hypothetical protein GUJ93_ZPchr0006g42212 [Zizania palustris]